MRILCSLCLLLWLGSGVDSEASTVKILKVLPQYLDKEGRHSLSPSLYERDAYQALLRTHPEKRAGLRFAINWKATHTHKEKLILRIELRSTGTNSAAPIILEQKVHPSNFFSHWSSLALGQKDYETFGQLTAWRASLWDGEQLLAEEKSFLW